MDQTGFLPDDYKAPVGNYTKLEAGENTIRVMSSAIVGYVYWKQDDKAVRLRKEPLALPEDIRVKDGKKDRVKHFWAFVVWNVEARKLQILELTQASIQTAIKAYVQNKKWGDPKGYDITISREGSGLDTEYTVMANPHTPIDPEAVEAFEAANIDLTALFDNGDPFAGERPVSSGSEPKSATGEVPADEEFAGLTDKQEATILSDGPEPEPVKPRMPKALGGK
jgi:hypothetical protein